MFGLFKKKEPIAHLKDFSDVLVDFHSHLIPAVDDGVKDEREALDILSWMANHGYKKVITSPHIMTEGFPNSRETLQAPYEKLKQRIAEENISIAFEYAAEYYMDDTFEQRIESEKLLTFSDNYILVEKSMSSEMPNLRELIYALQLKKHRVILAHPERYRYMFTSSLEQYETLKDAGVFFQINLFSLVGVYGNQSKEIAQKLIDAEMVDFVCSDIHKPEQVRFLEEVLKNTYLEKLILSGNLKNNILY